MNTSKVNKPFYFGRNKDGFVCAYDSETHKCVNVIVSTGDNIELYNEKHDSYIGEIDPKHSNSQQK